MNDRDYPRAITALVQTATIIRGGHTESVRECFGILGLGLSFEVELFAWFANVLEVDFYSEAEELTKAETLEVLDCAVSDLAVRVGSAFPCVVCSSVTFSPESSEAGPVCERCAGTYEPTDG